MIVGGIATRCTIDNLVAYCVALVFVGWVIGWFHVLRTMRESQYNYSNRLSFIIPSKIVDA